MVSYRTPYQDQLYQGSVLILIVVDNGLILLMTSCIHSPVPQVLILIVVDNGLIQEHLEIAMLQWDWS